MARRGSSSPSEAGWEFARTTSEPEDWELHRSQKIAQMHPVRGFFVATWGLIAVLFVNVFYSSKMTRDRWRRFDDLGHPMREYRNDDPRKYGVYFQGESGYVPKPGEQPFIAPEPEPPDYGTIRD